MPGLAAWLKTGFPAGLALARRVLPDALIDGFYLVLLRNTASSTR